MIPGSGLRGDRWRRAVSVIRHSEWWPVLVGSVDGSRRQGPRRHRVSGQCLKQAEFSGEIPMKKPAPVVALRIPAADLALARKQAEEKGLPYQTYIKSLLHETLAQRERRKAG